MNQKNRSTSLNAVSVIVFGDIGRSPRMKNHAMQLANAGYFVYLVGYYEQNAFMCQRKSSHSNSRFEDFIFRKVKEATKIFIFALCFATHHYSNILTPYPLHLQAASSQICANPSNLHIKQDKIIEQFCLYHILISLKQCNFQNDKNPPSVPVLSTLVIVCKIKKMKMVVDFHNYGFTILALSLKQKLILKLATTYEMYFGKKCDIAFCVSDAMKNDLKKNWKINAITLYDKANTQHFGPISIEEQHQLFLRLGFGEGDQTLLTELTPTGEVKYKSTRPLLIVSSTSWTKDEDFGILLDAMEAYESAPEVNAKYSRLPDLFLLITGKGPEKKKYEDLIKEKESGWRRIKIKTVWLEAEDYPKLLASADVGVCLHYSSSGLDLPMKVVDMLGSGIHVFAINYKCIAELVEEGKNGFIFNDSKELSSLFLKYFEKSEQNDLIIKKLRTNAANFRNSTWEHEWKQKALPVLSAIGSKQKQKQK